MTGTSKGLLLAAIQIALVLSLGAKLLYDRKTRPRVWVLSEVYDPELPIRGRYLSERLSVPAEGFEFKDVNSQNSGGWYANMRSASLEVRNGRLVARPQDSGPSEMIHLRKNADGTIVAVTDQPVLVFIPEHAVVPSLKPGQEMWVEVTVPVQGPPRPIRIGVKKDGVITPVNLD